MVDQIQSIKGFLEKDRDILLAYLYGSAAAGTIHPDSDIDIAVYLKEGDIEYYLKKDNEFLGNAPIAIGNDKIDIRILNIMPLLLKFKVIREGRLLILKDEQKRVDFETEVMDRYFEMKPYFDEYNRILEERIVGE